MEIKKAEFLISSAKLSQCPNDTKVEFAFIGRSNVGKSSLINMLTNRKGLAKTSATPGKTLLINHFNINDEWYIVDLPGYGFAKRSKKIQEDIEKMISSYILKREQCANVFLLIDIRHDPGENDITMYEWVVANGFKPVIICTKADKISRSQVQHQTAVIRKVLKAPSDTKIIPFSAETKQGRDDIWAYMEEMMAPESLPIEGVGDIDTQSVGVER